MAVDGMVHKPKVFDIDEVLRLGPLEERVYRMRCVEGWSMVIPVGRAFRWLGFWTVWSRWAAARYVAFQTLLDPARMPGQNGSGSQLAVRRRVADGRGDASAHYPRGRSLRPRTASPERSPTATGGSLEVRIQGDQVDRQDHPLVGSAADDMEPSSSVRIRILTRTSTLAFPIHAGARRPSSGSERQAVGRP